MPYVTPAPPPGGTCSADVRVPPPGGSALLSDALAVALVLGYGVAVNRLIPHALYVPANLAAAGVAVALARRVGVTWEGLGLSRDRLRAGMSWGVTTVAPIAAGVSIAVALPATQQYFRDQAVSDLTLSQAFYEVFVRIPLGTALAEEMLFRGALLGLFLGYHKPRTAVALSSVAFGLWHVLPTLHNMANNEGAAQVAASTPSKIGVVAGTVVVTTVAGVGLCWLRRRSGSLLAPWMAHTAINTLAFTAARFVGRA